MFWPTMIIGFLYVGVNCFILISGYYGIKFKIKGLIALYLSCLFYGLVGQLVHLYGGSTIDKHFFYDIFFCLSHNNWWFIRCYVILYLVAPLLNKAIESLDKRNFQLIILLLTIANVYFGYFWRSPYTNTTGYCAEHFIYVYMIGAYLKHHVNIVPTKHKRYGALITYIVCALIWGICSNLNYKYSIPHWEAYAYNNPIILLGAISLFICFSTLSIKNRYINWMASSVLAAYLIQDHKYIGYDIIYPYMQSLSMSLKYSNVIVTILFIFVVSIFFLIACVLLDKLRNISLARPILSLFDKKTFTYEKK